MRSPPAVDHRRRALKLESERRYEDAVRAYRDAARCEPESADAQVRLGVLLRDLGRDEEANRAFASALALRAAGAETTPRQQCLPWPLAEREPPAPGEGSDNIER